MKCEVVREGQNCGNDAEFIARTPWTTQLACVDCATWFRRYETQKLEFFCDWPIGGRECGEPATHYMIVDDAEVYHRPLCDKHIRHTSTKLIDDDFNPKLVPYKPPAQPQPRVEQKADGTVALRCHCGKAGKYRGGAEPMPLCDEHWYIVEAVRLADTPQPKPTTPKTEPPPIVNAQPTDVFTALEDLAVAVLQALTRKVEALTKKVQK